VARVVGPAFDCTDAELVVAIRDGDRSAVELLYDRYAARLHDFCYSMTRNRDDAQDAVQETFVAAMQKMSALRDPERLRPWLYAIARHQVFRMSRQRKRTVVTDELPEYASPAPGPEEDVDRAELSALVWAAAAGLAERDRALLDLHLRQGLDGADLAAAAGVSASHSYVMLTRLRDQVERSLGALLVARTGRADCTELAAITGGGAVELTPLLRKRIARHVDGCEVCAERRRRLVSPLALFGGVTPAFAALPVALRTRVLPAMHDFASHPDTIRVDKDGFPTEPTRLRPLPAAAAAGVAAVAVLAVLLSGTGGVGLRSAHHSIGPDATTPTPGLSLGASGPSNPQGTPTVDPSTGTTSPGPKATGSTTTVPSPADSSPPGRPRPTDTPTPTGSPPATTPAGPPPGIDSVYADDDHLVTGGNGCAGDHVTTTVHAQVGATATTVSMAWTLLADTANGPDQVASDTIAMTRDAAGNWEAQLGPFDQKGTAYYQIVASNDSDTSYGNQNPMPVKDGCIQ
jgi:RNA polymerase sigma factor (sigma-70 family)